ncbi:hypothetical protein MSAN_01032500 [Mycena sanguinolenta]|uniref:F-box domain-containing protein n=1 Tax=Mycena sanguinolenta TaxID=230812 RepID=A0A8H7D8U1_9AGAR|nr:hypothetical protein MSAN_01032500 [Mycena sanguinolenta]
MSLSNSPFTDRLNTNYVPSDSEILQIRALLVEPVEEVARINAQIAEMELAITQLKEKRTLLQTPIDAHKALISPMRLAPYDILQEIFLSCLPSKHNALIDFNDAPLLLGRVCRHWRSVAYSTPLLWSSIHIPPFDDLSVPPNIRLGLERVVAAWLERSASCPLSVSFFDSINRHFGSHALILQLVALSRRMRSLELSGDAELLHPLLQLGPEDVPLLKRILIKTPNHQTPSTNILQIPTLCDLNLTMSAVDPLSLPLPWSQLTSLRLESWGRRINHVREGGLDFDGALDVLRKCPNLEQCELYITKSSKPVGLPLIVLPRLHTLAFTGGWFHFEKWGSDLVAPNLRYLRIGQVVIGNNAPGALDHVSLKADIDPNRFTSSSLLEFLQSFPTISHLRLSAAMYAARPVSLDDGFIALFGPPHNLCPMLTHITLFAHAAGFSDAAALVFIKARMRMPTPLRRVGAEFRRPMELDIMPELRSFILDGLQVVVKYAPSPWKFKPQNGLDRL